MNTQNSLSKYFLPYSLTLLEFYMSIQENYPECLFAENELTSNHLAYPKKPGPVWFFHSKNNIEIFRDSLVAGNQDLECEAFLSLVEALLNLK